MTYPLASDVVDTDGVAIVRIARFVSSRDVLPHSSFALVVADAHDAGVKDAIELPALIGIFVVIVRSQINASGDVVLTLPL